MEKARRDKLRSVIGDARRLIEDSLTRQLAGYGLRVDSDPVPREMLSLRPDQEVHYARVRDAVTREGRATGGAGVITREAVSRHVREAGGTWINRLAALRALEARKLLDPAAAFVSDDYGDLSPRASRLRELAAEQGRSLSADDALRAGIEDACRELSESVRVLFDLSDENSLFWPDKTALKKLLQLFSVDVTADDWSQPDVLGWVYQYYNTEANLELKRRKKRTTGFKLQPDDIPIANQFYTPNWVVRVLADNTLGRLWLEMHERQPQLESTEETHDGMKETRWHLVERRRGVPHAAQDPEGFKAWIAEEPDPLRDGTVDRLCRFLAPLPSRPPARGRKSVRELKIIDPACGSGHFLLYAFDILFAMYREGEPGLDPCEIPALILENNLFGIDIDVRAAQLAAFDLYLKARTVLAAIDGKAQLQIQRLNIVVADAHLGDDPRKEAFLARYDDDPFMRTLYRKILDDVDHTNVLGSLLKVRTEFEAVFRQIRTTNRRKVRVGQGAWGSGQLDLLATSSQREFSEVFTSPLGQKSTLDELLNELKTFEAEVLPQQDIGARLFYTDLGRTVGLLGHLTQRYDVVLMNPPYGDMPAYTKDYAKGNKKKRIIAHYPRTHHNYATMFLEQALDLLGRDGLVGMLVPRSFMHLATCESIRTELLLRESRPELVLDLGRGILDRADVRVCASVVQNTSGDNSDARVAFARLAYFRDAQRFGRFVETFPHFAATGPHDGVDWFIARLKSLLDVPGMPYAYWATDTLRSLFRHHPPLDRDQTGVLTTGRPDKKKADTRVGLQTSDDSRFLRFHWEVSPDRIGRGHRWVSFVKGGSFVRFYSRTDLVVNWDREGREMKDHERWRRERGIPSRGTSALGKWAWFYMSGITWSAASWRLRRFGVLDEGNIFGHMGPALFLRDLAPICGIAYLNSAIYQAMMLMQTPERMWDAGMVGALPLPDAPPSAKAIEIARQLVERYRAVHSYDETCREFVVPHLEEIYTQHYSADFSWKISIESLLAEWLVGQSSLLENEGRLFEQLDHEAYEILDITAEDRALIGRELSRRPKAEGGYSGKELNEPNEPLPDEDAEIDGDGVDESGDGSEPTDDMDDNVVEICEEAAAVAAGRARDLISRWLSYYLGIAIRADDDGIVPIAATHGEPSLVIRLRDVIDRRFGHENAKLLEEQAPNYLGTETIGEWIEVSREEACDDSERSKRQPLGFFPWHVALYRSRPIFWLISSENFERGKTRFTLRAYLHYLKLTPDTLPKLVSYYLDPELDRCRSEYNLARDKTISAEGKTRRKLENDTQEWLNTVDALQRFRAALEGVIQGPLKAEPVPEKAKWLQRTIAAVRGGQDVGHGYQPDVDFGVRVNITPLAEARLLPRLVLKRLGG